MSISARCTCAIEAAATAGPKRRIDRRKRLAESGGDGRLRLALRERRHLVLQTFQIARDRRADDVRPGGEELAELDVSRAQAWSAPRQADSRRLLALGPLDQSRQCDHGLGRQRQRPCIDQRKYAFARKHEAGAGETNEMRGGSDHNRQPECNATTPPVIGVNDARRNPAASIIVAKTFGFGNFRIDSTRYW